MANTLFDRAAEAYDTTFTNTFVGQAQRRIVWKYVEAHWAYKGQPLRILELNCGTGEDALYLSKLGHHVLATDLSPHMIEQAQYKADQEACTRLTFKVLAIQDIAQLQGPFDLIFSNFGGLNCLSPQAMSRLAHDVHALLAPRGQCWVVLMSRKCLWERLYFQCKGNILQRDRRTTKGPLEVLVNQTTVPTWFYSPEETRVYFSPFLQHAFTKPVGIGIPPSYLNPMFEKNAFMRVLAIGIERLFGNFSWLSNRADHFLITFIKP